MTAFPESLRRRRERLKMSQRMLADELGVDQSSVAKWESGERRPSAPMLIRLMDLLGLGLSDVS